MATPTTLRTSPLDARHRALGAKMADFGGWSMPIEYPGGGVVRDEHAMPALGVPHREPVRLEDDDVGRVAAAGQRAGNDVLELVHL